MDYSVAGTVSQFSNAPTGPITMPQKSLRKTITITSCIVIGMFGFTFLLAPLYNSLCRATGIDGRGNVITAVNAQSDSAPVLNRDVTLQFVTTNNAELSWDFYPQKSAVDLHPEVNTKMVFFIKNKSDKTITVQAIPSITPWQAARHLHKVECFCFSQQTLKPGESLEMPVVLRIDKNLPSDIKTVTLAYTLFEVKKRKSA